MEFSFLISCLGRRGFVSEIKGMIHSSERLYREYLSCSSHGYVLPKEKKCCVDSCFFSWLKSHAEWISVIQCSQDRGAYNFFHCQGTELRGLHFQIEYISVAVSWSHTEGQKLGHPTGVSLLHQLAFQLDRNALDLKAGKKCDSFT